MWLLDRPGVESNPYQQEPFQHFTQISYLPQRLPWTPYPHFHEGEFEITLLTAGEFRLELPGRTLPLRGGAAVLIPPRVAHSIQYASGDHFEHHAVRFRDQDQRCQQWRALTREGVLCLRHCARSDAVRDLLMIIQTLADENGNTIDARVQTLAQGALELMEEELRRGGEIVKISNPVYANEILTYLQQHIHERVTMEDLSRAFHLSASHISRVFSKTYHTSPINYWIYCRMRAARLHILKEDMTTAQLAKSLAYHDVHHFIRAFEQFYGCHPDRYLEESLEFADLLWEPSSV